MIKVRIMEKNLTTTDICWLSFFVLFISTAIFCSASSPLYVVHDDNTKNIAAIVCMILYILGCFLSLLENCKDPNHRPTLNYQVTSVICTTPKPRCPVCAETVTKDLARCSRCDVIYHIDCYEYNGRCAIMGCQP